MNNLSLQNQLEMFNKERRELDDKLEGMSKEVAEKDKTIAELHSQLKNAQETGKLKEKELNNQITDAKN